NELGRWTLSRQFSLERLRALAHTNLANVLYCVGELDAAREHFERALESPDPFLTGEVAPSILPTVLLLLGYPAASLGKGRESLDGARLRPDPSSLARVLSQEAIRQVLLRDGGTANERAQEVLMLAARPELSFYGALSFPGARANFCRG